MAQMAGLRWHDWLLSVGQNGCFYSSANTQRIPISRIILSTVLSAITAPSSALRHIAICRCPQPLAVREKISAAASQSSGRVGLGGCARA